jgi:16S rRNA (guanine966-N2)-methyltransferase
VARQKNKSQLSGGQVRIIAGMWRSRKIVFPAIEGLRPTGDRIRETVFNWLQTDIAASRCLDLFSGSGALGFEAASRGASEVVMVEKHAEAVNCLSDNCRLLSANTISVHHSDALIYLSNIQNKFDIVFLDPPFALNMVADCCQALIDCQCLKPDSKVYIELDIRQKDAIPPNWTILRQKQSGEVSFNLLSAPE